MKDYQLTISGDYNDADYAVEIHYLDEAEAEFVRRVAAAIKQYGLDHPQNWGQDQEYEGLLTAEDIEKFSEYVPVYYGPDGEEAVHTIETITLLPLRQIEELL